MSFLWEGEGSGGSKPHGSPLLSRPKQTSGEWKEAQLSGIRAGELGQAGLTQDAMSSGSLSAGVTDQAAALWAKHSHASADSYH